MKTSESTRGKKRLVALIAAALLVVIGVVWVALRPEDPVAKLARELRSDDPEVRYGAAKDLEELGPNALLAVDVLSIALRDDELRVRYRAAKALSRMGPSAEAAVPALSAALKDVDRDVRYYAAKALYKIDNDAEPALESVVQVLDVGEPDPDVRRYLVKTLGEIGQDSRRAHDVVRKLLRDPDARVREEVAEALEEFGENE